MSSAKVAVSIDEKLLREVDRWVSEGEYASRSGVIQEAIKTLRDKRSRKTKLLAELAKLDPDEERELANEWLSAEASWPQY
jgi:Arc/MetJ-type ribon-helix-helix transcriptional regulator